jgi:DmsE family decaheme c-type cytochrome
MMERRVAQHIWYVQILCIAAISVVMDNRLLAAETGPNLAAPAEARANYSDMGADTCLSCHNDQRMLVIFRTAHGQDSDPKSPFAHLQCESCHGPGGDHAGRRNVGAGHPAVVRFGNNANTPIDQQDAVCANCHTKHAGLQWTGSAHQRNEVGCAACHSVHEKVDRVSVLTEQAGVCSECHPRQRADSHKPYAHPITSGVMTCTTCHDLHNSFNSALLKRDNLNELCWSCHTELRGPFLFEHAPVPEDCLLCHHAHGSIHPAMLTRRSPLLCQACHSRAGHPSASFVSGQRIQSVFVAGGSCQNCHRQVHGSNHPSGVNLMR